MGKPFRFQLKGKTAVFVDWANVYGWKKSLKKEVGNCSLCTWTLRKRDLGIKKRNF